MDELFAGLKALAASAFPKQCAACGRRFDSVEQYIAATEKVGGPRSGLKEGWDDDDRPLLEVYRNCTCGSTLMEFFSDRRDQTDNGLQRRARFDALVAQLETRGWSHEHAHAELLKLMRGEASSIGELVEADRRRNR